MLVIGGPDHGAPNEYARAILIGREYPVLAVLVEPDPKHPMSIALLVLDEEDGASWWPSTFFTTISTTIPSNWIAVVDDDGALHLAPEPWLEKGFWESRYSNDSEALEAYRTELEVILSEL